MLFVFFLLKNFLKNIKFCNHLKPSESENVGDVWNKPKSLDDKGPAPVMMIDHMTGEAWNLMSRVEEPNREDMAGDLNIPKHLEPMTGAPWSKPAQLDINAPQMMTQQMVGVSNEPNQLDPMVGGSWSKSTHLQDPNEQLLGAPWTIDAITAGISKIVTPLSPSVSIFYC